ncbi:MAG: hypothetical protein M1587_03715 [Thaumarchaeota archaeon]|nr:hypothetical protein [Nitrososphaerota archaeon]
MEQTKYLERNENLTDFKLWNSDRRNVDFPILQHFAKPEFRNLESFLNDDLLKQLRNFDSSSEGVFGQLGQNL